MLNVNPSFRTRLLGIVSLGITCLALTAALTTALVTSKQVRTQMVAQGLQITGNLATQSVLALLYASEENAEKPLQAIMGFPNIDRAGIFDSTGIPLLIMGAEGAELPDLETFRQEQQPMLVSETAAAWYFLAPVYAGASAESQALDDSPFQLERPIREFLGFSYVGMNKAALRAIKLKIFANNILIGLSFALVLVFILNFGIKRLTRPLYQLSEIMREAEREGAYMYADLHGPQEITHMAGVFNRMMTSLEERDRRLRRHQGMLQHEVAVRTKELVEARDAALAASRTKSEFLANMSHELRTPLQAIIGYADVIREELDLDGKDESAGELERVIYNAQRLLALINNVLGLAKVEAGRMEVQLEPVSMRRLVQEAVDAVEPIVRGNRNQLEVTVDEGPVIHIDREKTLQAALNLLSNAGKFTTDGVVALTVTQSPDLLQIRVADTGIGIASDKQKIIFEEFRQVDGSTTRRFEGTGLGLAITRRFCELMGGSVQVESTLGRGAAFTIRIPLPIIVAPGEAADQVELPMDSTRPVAG